jgi:hypothetical protein
VLRRIFGSKGDEVTKGWAKLHSKELRNLYSSPSIIKMIKSKRMRWVGHVARIGGRETRIGYFYYYYYYYYSIEQQMGYYPVAVVLQ